MSELNILPIAEDYFNTIFSEITDMKVLILDAETVGIISVIFSRSKLLKNDIFLIQRVADKGDKMPHLKALYFVRPTQDNVDQIVKEIKDPRYKEYHIFFTNEIPVQFIELMAVQDTGDRIKSLQ